MDFTGKVILITGGGRGIGRAAALKFARHGADVALAARTAADLEAVAGEIRALGRRVVAVPTDTTNREQVTAFVAATISQLGRIDVVVNAAGIGILKPFLELTEADLDRMLAVNVRGVFNVTQVAAPEMTKTGGGIVINIPGILGRAAMMQAAGYCASKFAVTGMTRAMALDLKRNGIRFTLLHFGGVDSPFWDTIAMRVQRDKMLSVEEAANAILFAASHTGNGVLNELVLQPESHQM
ncbi:SDR family oxidoreductase [Chloracidobacterium aggregatum]|jgi:NAD(P)-dependent dehydrogenase (short-subunit alcohol dehydrogenase family)|uniref:SDR family oxidoreductase n=1 Tax=Chloracidobacterium aggregatum TaxID=2851959 RepID=UPI001B8B04E1|nr:SDR family oxidoreductase [Chloracidobacterium aggregatum]QUV97703.1 SDR family oxidoreductase [Chloracidobacterium sp. E]